MNSFPQRVSDDAAVFAQRMARSYREMVEFYSREGGHSWQQANTLARQDGEEAQLAQRVLGGDPGQVSWWALSGLAERHPELAQQAWARIRAFAKEELQTGHTAAVAVIPACGVDGPMDRARFLAIREALAVGWAPVNPLEQQLVDIMAQAHAQWLFWMARGTLRSTLDAFREEHEIREGGRWTPPRVTDSEATEQAMTMAERYNRIFIRTLRAMRDLRRFTPGHVTIRAGQVNIAQQQVNSGTDAVSVDGRPGHRHGDEVQDDVTEP